MKLFLVTIALVFAGVKAQEHPPDRGAVPCFYWDDYCTSSYGVDFPGNDIAIYRTETTADCCNQCKAKEGCLHWVTRPAVDGGLLCHLKSVYGFPTYCDDCVFSYTKSDACKSFCETTCHNLNEFGPAVCGTDGYTYESPCQMTCTGVSKADDGECDSPFRDPQPRPEAPEAHEAEPTAEVHEAESKPAEVHEAESSPEGHEAEHSPAEVHEAEHSPAEVHEAEHSPAEVHEAEHSPAEVHEAHSESHAHASHP